VLALAAFAFALFAVPALAASAIAVGRVDPSGRRTVTLGRSVDGTLITAVETGDFDESRRALVVGCIHGNETAGIAIAERLARAAPPSELDLWIIPDLNPDGAAVGRRGNGRGVDLNRNFPWRWRPLGGIFDSGPRPLSEPESRIAYHLIARVRPRVAVWFHQHLDVVDESGGRIRIERRFAMLAGLRLARLPREPGSAVGWENHDVPAGTAFVVELPAGSLSTPAVSRFARAVVAVSRLPGPTPQGSRLGRRTG
jgi:murein peptide amidase A